jgi:hypothetical protein
MHNVWRSPKICSEPIQISCLGKKIKMTMSRILLSNV